MLGAEIKCRIGHSWNVFMSWAVPAEVGNKLGMGRGMPTLDGARRC